MEQYVVSEGEETVEVCWNLEPGNVMLERTVEFLANTQINSALEADYTALSDFVVSPNDQNDVCVTIQVASDSIIENTEDFGVELFSLDPAINLISNPIEVCDYDYYLAYKLSNTSTIWKLIFAQSSYWKVFLKI